MDIITAATMDSLVSQNGEQCVSVYMPTHNVGPETAQDPIRLANLLDAARADLIAAGIRSAQADEMLQEARQLTTSSEYWHHQDGGLALFVTPQRTAIYRLPLAFEPLVTVSDRFHVKPLWPLVGGGELFYLLTLSRNEVRLLWADQFRVGGVALPADVPKSLAEALWFDDPERQLQHHPTARIGSGRVMATFHGHGMPDEKGDAKLKTFLRAVSTGLHELVDAGTPLVLAGVDDITAVFREVSKHQPIMDETIHGNAERLSPDDLHARAVDIMRPYFSRTLDADRDRFGAAGELALSEVVAVVEAAQQGRVAVLFLPVGTQVWGRSTADGTSVDVHESRQSGDWDLLDLAGTATWSKGGRVHALAPGDIPGEGVVAATLRY